MRFAPLLLCVIVLGCGPSDADKPVQIGHVCPVGPIGDEELALKMAVEELNIDMSRQPEGRRVEIRHAQGGATPVEWGAQSARLVALNKVNGLIISGGEADAEKAGMAIQGENVIGLSVAGWAGGPPRNLFTVGISPGERGRVLAAVAKELKANAVLVLREPAAKAANLAADRFVADLRATGIKITEAEIPAAEKPSSDLVFLACSAKSAIQHRPKDAKAMFGGDDTELTALINGSAATDGVFIASALAPVGQTQAFSNFIEKFRSTHNRRTPSVEAMLAHDALSIWIEAARRAKSYDSSAIRDELRKSDQPFDALTGTLTFNNDQAAQRSVFVWQISGGQLMSRGDLNKKP
jgi:ABC-type branched-subunit amino acid transport system substrate-binding protein